MVKLKANLRARASSTDSSLVQTQVTHYDDDGEGGDDDDNDDFDDDDDGNNGDDDDDDEPQLFQQQLTLNLPNQFFKSCCFGKLYSSTVRILFGKRMDHISKAFGNYP